MGTGEGHLTDLSPQPDLPRKPWEQVRKGGISLVEMQKLLDKPGDWSTLISPDCTGSWTPLESQEEERAQRTVARSLWLQSYPLLHPSLPSCALR